MTIKEKEKYIIKYFNLNSIRDSVYFFKGNISENNYDRLKNIYDKLIITFSKTKRWEYKKG